MASQNLEPIFASFTGEPREIIPLLQAVQRQEGYLPEDAIRAVADFTRTAPSRVYGVATFYSQFHLTPQGRQRVQVCRGTACHVRGAGRVLAEAKKQLGLDEGETSDDYEYTLETVTCLSACALAPCITVNGEIHGELTPAKVSEVLNDHRSEHNGV